MRAYGSAGTVPHETSRQCGVAITGHLQVKHLFGGLPWPFVPRGHWEQCAARCRALAAGAFIYTPANRGPCAGVDVSAAVQDDVLPCVVLHDNRISRHAVYACREVVVVLLIGIGSASDM